MASRAHWLRFVGEGRALGARGCPQSPFPAPCTVDGPRALQFFVYSIISTRPCGAQCRRRRSPPLPLASRGHWLRFVGAGRAGGERGCSHSLFLALPLVQPADVRRQGTQGTSQKKVTRSFRCGRAPPSAPAAAPHPSQSQQPRAASAVRAVALPPYLRRARPRTRAALPSSLQRSRGGTTVPATRVRCNTCDSGSEPRSCQLLGQVSEQNCFYRHSQQTRPANAGRGQSRRRRSAVAAPSQHVTVTAA